METFKPSVLQESITKQLIQHHLLDRESKNKQIREQFSIGIQGKQLDKFCIEKEANLMQLNEELRQIKREKEQLRQLNEKLIARCEELQSLIEQEAQAKKYYYNYPPKPEEDLGVGAVSETEKVRKLYEDQIANLTRKNDREFGNMVLSFSTQIEDLQDMLSNINYEYLKLKRQFIETDTKFKDYVRKSDIYIRDKDKKLAEVQKEVEDMSYRYQNHGEIFRQEKERADKN